MRPSNLLRAACLPSAWRLTFTENQDTVTVVTTRTRFVCPCSDSGLSASSNAHGGDWSAWSGTGSNSASSAQTSTVPNFSYSTSTGVTRLSTSISSTTANIPSSSSISSTTLSSTTATTQQSPTQIRPPSSFCGGNTTYGGIVFTIFCNVALRITPQITTTASSFTNCGNMLGVSYDIFAFDSSLMTGNCFGYKASAVVSARKRAGPIVYYYYSATTDIGANLNMVSLQPAPTGSTTLSSTVTSVAPTTTTTIAGQTSGLTTTSRSTSGASTSTTITASSAAASTTSSTISSRSLTSTTSTVISSSTSISTSTTSGTSTTITSSTTTSTSPSATGVNGDQCTPGADNLSYNIKYFCNQKVIAPKLTPESTSNAYSSIPACGSACANDGECLVFNYKRMTQTCTFYDQPYNGGATNFSVVASPDDDLGYLTASCS